jgi:hypothetical protein
MSYHEVGEEDLKSHLMDFTRLKQVHSKRLTSRLPLITILMPTLLLLHGRESRYGVLSSLKLYLERNESDLSSLYILSKISSQISLKNREFLPKCTLYLWVVYELQISWLEESEFLCCSPTIVCNSNVSLSQVSIVFFLLEFVQRSLIWHTIMLDNSACNKYTVFADVPLLLPVTVAERSKTCTVFSRSEAGAVGSNPSQGMDV